MALPFCLIFRPDGTLSDVANLPDRLVNRDPESILKMLKHSFMLGEAERFRRFCAEPPGYTVCSGYMTLFRINGFGGYQFAFGEKVLIDGQVRIHLYLFRKYRHLFEFTAPMYQRFIRASQALNGETDTVLTPAAALIDDKAPSLFYSEESITDIQELTEKILRYLSEDPVFAGNRLTLIEQGERDPYRYLIRFSSPAYTHLLYALLATVISLSRSHEIFISLNDAGSGIGIDIRTDTGIPCPEPLSHAVNLTAIAALVPHCDVMLAFADMLAAGNGFVPSVSLDPGSASFSVSLLVGSDSGLDSDFHYRDPYASLSSVLLEAAGLWHLFTSSVSFDEQKQ